MPGSISKKTKPSKTNRTIERGNGGTIWKRTGSGSAIATDGTGRIVKPKGPAQKKKANED